MCSPVKNNTKQVLTSSAIPAAATSPAAPSAAAMLALLPAVLALALAEPAVAAVEETAEASEGTRECVALGAAEGAPLAETVKKQVLCESGQESLFKTIDQQENQAVKQNSN